MEERIAALPARSFLRATRDPEGGPPASPSYCRPAGDVQLERQAGQASSSGDRLKPVTGRVVSDRGAGDAADCVEVDIVLRPLDAPRVDVERGLQCRDRFVRGMIPLSSGYPVRGINGPRTRDCVTRPGAYNCEQGERGSRRCGRPFSRAAARRASTSAGVTGHHSVIPSNQCSSQPTLYGSQASPPVSQPSSTWVEISSATRSRNGMSASPSIASSPTTAP